MQSETLVEEFSRLVREYKQDDGPGGIEAWNLIADFAVDNADAIEAALSAAEPQPAPSVAVKALEWSDEDNGDFIAQSIVGWYHIGLPHLTWNLMTPNGDVPSFNTLKEAKAAAQADYEARVSSALSAQVQEVAGDEEWQIVPKHPTGSMIEAVVSMVDDDAPHLFLLNLYRAMLAAAPAKQED